MKYQKGVNVPFDLTKSVSQLVETVTGLLKEAEFRLLAEEHNSIIDGDILYWNRHFDQGFVAINTNKKEVYLVSSVEDVENKMYCDPAIAELTNIDINDYIHIYSENRAKKVLAEIDRDILLAIQEEVLTNLHKFQIH